MFCGIWYHFYNLKNMKNTHEGVFLTKNSTPPWVVFTFYKLYKWYQTAQRITVCKQFLVIILHLLMISVLRQLSFDQVHVSFLVKINKREICSNNVLVCIFKKHLLVRRGVYRGVETSILVFGPDLIRFYYGLLFPIYVNF